MLGIKIIRQNCQGLVETLGKYSHSVEAGLHFYIPFIQRIESVELAMHPLKLQKYSVIRMDLNAALGSTSKINAELAAAIGDLTNIYGINVDRVNIDELTPSVEIQKAMDKQLTADRERVAVIAKAEGEARNIKLTTDAKNQALVETAQAEAEATRMRADAESYRIEKIRAALESVSDNYFRDQSIAAFTKLAQSDTNLVVMSKDEITDLGNIPVIDKMLDMKK